MIVFEFQPLSGIRRDLEGSKFSPRFCFPDLSLSAYVPFQREVLSCTIWPFEYFISIFSKIRVESKYELNNNFNFEAVFCLICRLRRMAVSRHGNICLPDNNSQSLYELNPFLNLVIASALCTIYGNHDFRCR